MSEDVSNDLHSVRPCAQIRSLLESPRMFVCVRTHGNAITHRERQHRTITWRRAKAMSAWWTAVMWIWILKKKKSFSPALFSMMHVEALIFNAAHKPIHSEDRKALLTAESCSSRIYVLKNILGLYRFSPPIPPARHTGRWLNPLDLTPASIWTRAQRKRLEREGPVNKNLNGNFTFFWLLVELVSISLRLRIGGATLVGWTWVFFN